MNNAVLETFVLRWLFCASKRTCYSFRAAFIHRALLCCWTCLLRDIAGKCSC